jgi:hypothetical protein
VTANCLFDRGSVPDAQEGGVHVVDVAAVEIESPRRWRWRLLDNTGRTVADHQVNLDEAAEYEAFRDLCGHVTG